MKPTVIAGNSQETNSNNGNNNNGSKMPTDSRQFPNFQTAFGMNDGNVDDIFSNAGLRSRLNRMRDPWGSLRKNSDPDTNPYEQFFKDDDTEFFQKFRGPHWDSFKNRRKTTPKSQIPNETEFFDHIPSEFRNYIPENFGFPNKRNQQFSKKLNEEPQYYEAYVQPMTKTREQNHYQNQIPKYTDTAVQTEESSLQPKPIDIQTKKQNLQQHGLRNTVDLGQKSPSEEYKLPRAQSAPPSNLDSDISINKPAHTSTFNRVEMNLPPPKPQAAFTKPQEPNRYKEDEKTDSLKSGASFIRHIPIFVEGRSDPVESNNEEVKITNQEPNETKNNKKVEQQFRPSPLVTENIPTVEEMDQQIPQTPQSIESITKIQSIQRNVLDLMSKVENFKGLRGDKDYIYLDEMLTRNLLALDTIDTNGKESIRLARKEAIKCIQASINVLEAKAEENSNNFKIETNNSISQTSTLSEDNNIRNNDPIPLPDSSMIDTEKSQDNQINNNNNETENINETIVTESISDVPNINQENTEIFIAKLPEENQKKTLKKIIKSDRKTKSDNEPCLKKLTEKKKLKQNNSKTQQELEKN